MKNVLIVKELRSSLPEIIRELRLKKVLTCDRHFRDAGFEILS